MHGTDAMAKLGLAAASILAAVALVAIVLMAAGAPMPMRPPAEYYGARLIPPGGPASVGLPAIPVRVTEDGRIVGVPARLDVYDYCSATLPALSPDYEGSEEFRYALRPEKLEIAHRRGVDIWFEGLLGKPVRASDFTEDWQGAAVVWRGDASGEHDALRAIVLRVGPDADYPRGFRNDFAKDGFVAFMAPSTGYCCTAGYEESGSEFARRGGWSLIYDTCHDSLWDPRSVRLYPSDFREDGL